MMFSYNMSFLAVFKCCECFSYKMQAILRSFLGISTMVVYLEEPVTLVLRQIWGNFIQIEIRSPFAVTNQIQLCHTFAV